MVVSRTTARKATTKNLTCTHILTGNKAGDCPANEKIEMAETVRLIPIYTTRGDLGAFLAYPYIYSTQGDWIGWVTREREVFSVHGHYVGWMSSDPRILRKRSFDYSEPPRTPPPRPDAIRPPAQAALAPQMPELSLNVIDVLDEDPDLLPSLDYGELRQDLD